MIAFMQCYQKSGSTERSCMPSYAFRFHFTATKRKKLPHSPDLHPSEDVSGWIGSLPVPLTSSPTSVIILAAEWRKSPQPCFKISWKDLFKKTRGYHCTENGTSSSCLSAHMARCQDPSGITVSLDSAPWCPMVLINVQDGHVFW